MARRIRWRWEPVNMVEAAAVVAAAGCLLARGGVLVAGQLGGQGLAAPAGTGAGAAWDVWPWAGLAVYAFLRRWVPGGEATGREPVRRPSCHGDRGSTARHGQRPPRRQGSSSQAGLAPSRLAGRRVLVVVVVMVPLLVGAFWGAGPVGGSETSPVPPSRPALPVWAVDEGDGMPAARLHPTRQGRVLGWLGHWMVALGRLLAAPVAFPWPVAIALLGMLFQAYRRDGRLRRWTLVLMAATAMLVLGTWLPGSTTFKVQPGPAAAGSGVTVGDGASPAVQLSFWLAMGLFNAVYTGRSRLLPSRGAPRRKPPVLISGFYGAGNAGDEAILASLVGLLRERGYADITVLSIRPEETARRYGVTSIYRGWRRAWVAKARAFLRAGIFISGGGGLLQDTTPTFLLRGPVPYYLLIAAWARLSGCWVLFLGQGVGPLRGRWVRWLTRWIANHADVITVRDAASLDLLAELGVSRPHRRLLADFVFAGPPADPMRAAEVARQEGLTPGAYRVVVSVRRWPGDEQFYPELAAFIRRILASRPDAEVVLVPMEGELDRVASERLVSWVVGGGGGGAAGDLRDRLPAPGLLSRLRVLGTHWQPADLEALVASARLAVGMRLHFLLFAARAGVPVLALNYDPKVAQAMDRLGCSQFVFDLADVRADALWSAFCTVEELRSDLVPALSARAARLAGLAAANLDYVDAAARRTAGAA